MRYRQTGFNNTNQPPPYYEREVYRTIEDAQNSRGRSQSPNDNRSRSFSPYSNNYNTQSPFNYRSNNDANSPAPADGRSQYGYRESELSENRRAQIQREKAILDDNMKDLAYMELLQGGDNKRKYKDKRETSQGPPVNAGKYAQINNEWKQQYNSRWDNQNERGQPTQPRDKDDRMSLGELKNREPSPYQQMQNEYQYRSISQGKSSNQNNQQSPLKIEGLTPKASKHYEGVKNLYWQELEILKHNIQQCQMQDQKLVPSYEMKEQRLWQSFSRSPSPNRPHTIEESPIAEDLDDNTNQNVNEIAYDPSPTKLKEVSRPENILKNEIYKLMLKEQPMHNQSNYHDSSCILTYSKHPGDFSQTSQFALLKSSIATKKGITPYDEYQQHQQQRNQPNNPMAVGSGPIITDEDLDRNQNVNSTLEQQKKGVSFSSKDKSFIYDKSSPSIATNPYKKNLYDVAGSNIITEENLRVVDDTTHNAHNLTLSPGLHSGDDGNEQEEEEYNQQLRQQQEQEMSSPYRQLGYLQQMKKIREDRQKEIQELQLAESMRDNFQRNVLRQRVNKGFQDFMRSKLPLGNTAQSQLSKKQLEQHSGQKVNQQSKFLTPQKDSKAESLYSQRSKQSYRDVLSFNQQIYSDYQIGYQDFVRRVSKYDIDRAQVNFKKIMKEKEKDRTDNVKTKKHEVEKDDQHKKKLEVEITDQKISSLQVIKQRQEKERRDFLRKQQDAFRRAIEERAAVDKSMQYLSPNSNQKVSKKGNKQLAVRDNNLGTPKKIEGPPQPINQWANEIQIEPYSDRKGNNENQASLNQKLKLNLPLNRDDDQKQ